MCVYACVCACLCCVCVCVCAVCVFTNLLQCHFLCFDIHVPTLIPPLHDLDAVSEPWVYLPCGHACLRGATTTGRPTHWRTTHTGPAPSAERWIQPSLISTIFVQCLSVWTRVHTHSLPPSLPQVLAVCQYLSQQVGSQVSILCTVWETSCETPFHWPY